MAANESSVSSSCCQCDHRQATSMSCGSRAELQHHVLVGFARRKRPMLHRMATHVLVESLDAEQGTAMTELLAPESLEIVPAGVVGAWEAHVDGRGLTGRTALVAHGGERCAGPALHHHDRGVPAGKRCAHHAPRVRCGAGRPAAQCPGDLLTGDAAAPLLLSWASWPTCARHLPGVSSAELACQAGGFGGVVGVDQRLDGTLCGMGGCAKAASMPGEIFSLRPWFALPIEAVKSARRLRRRSMPISRPGSGRSSTWRRAGGLGGGVELEVET